MPMWLWIAIGLASFLGPSLLFGIAMTRILGAIGQHVSEMYETDAWARVPPTRASREVEKPQPEEVEVKRSRFVRAKP
jgi:hypothetical protein